MPRAASLADLLKQEGFTDIHLIPGTGGVFDVVADGHLIYSKHREGRHPDPHEILRLLGS